MNRKRLITLAVLLSAAEAWASVPYERVISLDSVNTVAVTGQPTVQSRLFGTGAYRYYTNSTCTTPGPAVPLPSTTYYITLVITPSGGLVYSNGEYPGNSPPLQTFPRENFNQQNNSGTPNCRKVVTSPFGAFRLTGLILISTSGGSLTFSNTTYTYSGSTFNAHGGSYKARNAIPEPGTIALLLGGIGGLAFSRYRRRRNSSAA